MIGMNSSGGDMHEKCDTRLEWHPAARAEGLRLPDALIACESQWRWLESIISGHFLAHGCLALHCPSLSALEVWKNSREHPRRPKVNFANGAALLYHSIPVQLREKRY